VSPSIPAVLVFADKSRKVAKGLRIAEKWRFYTSSFLAGSRGGGEVSFPSIHVSKDTFELPARHYVASSRNAILSEIDTQPPRCLTEAKYRARGLLYSLTVRCQ
jgi:hypothetical protein